MPSRRPRRLAADISIVAALTFVADILTKRWALNHLQQGVVAPYLPPLLGLTLVTNTGTAFGMWRSERLVGLLVPPLICIAIIFWIFRKQKNGRILSAAERVGFGLILGGAIGNMCDRFTFGHVIDFLYFPFWSSFPVFNLADALIDVGVGLIILQALLTPEQEQVAKEESPTQTSGDAHG